MFNMLKAIRFNNKMNKAAKLAATDLGLEYYEIVKPLGTRQGMELYGDAIVDLEDLMKSEGWTIYELALHMLMFGFGYSQITGLDSARYDSVINRVRWWENIGVIRKGYAELAVGAFDKFRTKLP